MRQTGAASLGRMLVLPPLPSSLTCSKLCTPNWKLLAACSCTFFLATETFSVLRQGEAAAVCGYCPKSGVLVMETLWPTVLLYLPSQLVHNQSADPWPRGVEPQPVAHLVLHPLLTLVHFLTLVLHMGPFQMNDFPSVPHFKTCFWEISPNIAHVCAHQIFLVSLQNASLSGSLLAGKVWAPRNSMNQIAAHFENCKLFFSTSLL